MAPSSVSVSRPAMRIDAEDQRISKMIKEDLKEYWSHPKQKVLNDPFRAIVYSVAIKSIAWFVALIFPFIAYTAFGFSVALIDRVAFNNFDLFFQGIIHSCKDFVNSGVVSVRNRIGDFFIAMADSL